nr:hypothetical protein [uncultured bacterium]
MKIKLLILLFLIFISSISFGQTYSYSKKTVKVIVQSIIGNEYRELTTSAGPYRFVFETPHKGKKLFILLKPNEKMSLGKSWYEFLKDDGFIEMNKILYKKSIYYYTETDEQVTVLISKDSNSIIIFNDDDTIWEFSN